MVGDRHRLASRRRRGRRMSTTYGYRIELQQGVSAGRSGERGNVRASHTVVPGGVVRGALAGRYLAEREKPRADADFVAMFERGVQFGQAVPQGMRLEPLSRARCKYPQVATCHSWSHDAALALAAGQQPETRCPHCGGALSYGRGWQRVDRRDELQRVTRTKLSANETSERGQLYTRESLRRGQVLTGRLIMDQPFDWLLEPRRIRLGGQRSTSGSAQWSVAAVEDSDATIASTAALCLRSPAVVVDDFGAPTLVLDAPLERALGRPVRVLGAWTRPESVQGWHTASGLPKPHDWAVAPGSTVVLDELAAPDLARLERGIGLRRIEGFGEIDLLRDDSWAIVEAVEDLATHTPELIERITAAVVPELRRDALSRLLGAVRHVASYRRPGVAQADVEREVAAALDAEWARRLPVDVETVLRLILSDPNNTSWEATIAAAQRRLREASS